MGFASFLLFLFLFIIYSLGVSPSVYGGDSGDIILAAWFGGVAHPPGYPLNTIIGWTFTHLPYSASVAFKANLMAASLMAAAISLLFLTLEKLTKNFFVSLSASLILAFTPLFWLYAHIIEVFQLNILLIGLSFYFLVSWRQSVLIKKVNDVYLKLAFLFVGFAFFHHQTSVLLFPAYAFLIFKTDKKIIKNRRLIASLTGLFALGFLPYLFIPFAAFKKTAINWDDPVTLSNFIHLITRGDYGTFLATTHTVGSELKPRLIQLADFFLFLKSDFSIIGSILLAIGAVYTFFKERIIFYFVFIAAFLTGPFFLFYASFPLVNDFYFGLWERFALLPYFLLSIYLGFGLRVIYNLATDLYTKSIKTRLLSKNFRNLLVGGLLLFFPFYLAIVNYPKTNLSKFFIGDWLGYDTLVSVEPNSILFIYNDTMTFNSQYIYYSQNNPDNIKLILAGRLRHLEYREQARRSFADLKYPGDFLERAEADGSKYIIELIHSNIDLYSIYSTDYLPQITGYKWMTVGLASKLVKSDSYSNDTLTGENISVYNEFKYKDFKSSLGYKHYITSHIQGIYYNSLIKLIDELLENGQEDEAYVYLDKATTLLPEAKGAYVRLGNIYFKNEKCTEAKDNFEKALSIDKHDWRLAEILSDIYGKCLNDGVNAKKYFDVAKELKEKIDSGDKI